MPGNAGGHPTTPGAPTGAPDSTAAGARPEQGAERERQVRRIFSEIAPRYDLLNHVLSLNIDRSWRRKAVRALGVGRRPGGRYLDACAGTFDLAIEVAKTEGFRGRVIASDFAFPMLSEGRAKLAGRPILPTCADTLRLPFADGVFDGAMVGFGVRNLSDLDRGFRELRRVLRPGARLVILEFTVPPNRFVRFGYMLYFTRILPLVGRIVSGHPWAYSYLPASVREHPGPEDLAARLEAAGFASADWSLVTAGIAAIHVAAVA